MAISLAGQTGITGGNGTSPATLTYSSTAGNTLILAGHLYDNNNGQYVAPVSITDSTGGTNVWQVSVNAANTALTAQTPPLCSLADPTDGGTAHMSDWVAWCVNAAHVTSVTVAWAGGVSTLERLTLSEWSGIAQFDNSWASGTTVTPGNTITGSLQLNTTGELVIAAVDVGGAPSGITVVFYKDAYATTSG